MADQQKSEKADKSENKPEPSAAGPPPSKAEKPQGKVVVLHSVVRRPNRKDGDNFHHGQDATSGQVLDAHEFGDRANVARLTEAGAIRPASQEESDQSKVDLLSASTPHDTVEAKTAEMRKKSEAKDQRIRDLEEELSQYKAREGDRVSQKAGEEQNRGK